MRFAILLTVLFAVFIVPAFGAGTYVLLDEDFESAGYWSIASPPTGWTAFTGDGAPDDGNDWEGRYAGASGVTDYHAWVDWSPRDTTNSYDGLYTSSGTLDFSSIVINAGEGDELYVEFDHNLDWYTAGSYTGTAFIGINHDGGSYTPISWDHPALDVNTVTVDLAPYAGTTDFKIYWLMQINDTYGLDDWSVDNIKITHVDEEDTKIKSASLGEIKASYR